MKRRIKMIPSKKGSFLVITVLVLSLTFMFWSPKSFAQGKTFAFKFATSVPEKSFMGGLQKWWANEIEKRTNGRVKIQIFWMESLIEWKDMYHGVKSGVAEIGNPCSTYDPSIFPLFMVLDMPYNVRDYWAGNMAAIDTAENEPHLKAELEKAGIKFLANHNSGFFQMATRKPFTSISELRGKSFRTFGGARIKWMENLGINPIFMSYGEIYEAMDRGTIFGFDLVFQLSDAFKHYEVCKYVGLANSGLVVTCPTSINLKVWNSLPKDIQDVFLKVREEYAARFAEELYKLESGFMEKWKTKHGVTIQKLSPEEDRIAREAGRKAQEWFLDKQEAGGHPARKVWDYFQKSQRKYEEEIKTKGYPWERKR
jgi:TRAP-type C4-dicarboxylate transport system substrate-binding protein